MIDEFFVPMIRMSERDEVYLGQKKEQDNQI